MLPNSISQRILETLKQHLAPTRTLTPAGRDLLTQIEEEDGWRVYLRRIAARTFTSDFFIGHEEFWNWYWRLLKLRMSGEPLSEEILTFIAAWFRSGGKSSNIEWACITEGAMGLPGYVLYVSKTQESAKSHVSDIRKRLESEAVSRYFPDLAEPEMGKHGNRWGWNQEFLITKGGWAIRPIGLDQAVRGLKSADLRPTMIVFDDIDDFDVSPAQVESNLKKIARSILPAGTTNTIHLVAQNLITEHSAVNQIVTGKTDVLSEHIASVYPAFDPDTLVVEKTIEDDGRSSYEITSCEPVWSEIDSDAARRYLNKVGLEAFYAEYQHDFSYDTTDRVIPEYDDEIHVITWSQFREHYGTHLFVPDDWQIGVGLDIGYTKSHLSAWSWIGVSAENAYIPNSFFRYRGMTFVGKSITEQAIKVKEAIRYVGEDNRFVEEDYSVSRISHEKSGETLILNDEYEFNFSPAKFKKEDGIPQWRNLLRVDRRQPHPFHKDELLTEEQCLKQRVPLGYYRLGRPNFFDVVADDERHFPTTDAGLAIHRAQVMNWKRKKVKLATSGFQAADPMKFEDDACFPAGTLITTRRGQIPIECVAEDDYVFTRFGFSKVIKSGQTGVASRFTKVTSEGRTLIATNNHPIYKNNSFSTIDTTSMYDKLLLCQIEKQSYSTRLGITDTPIPNKRLTKDTSSRTWALGNVGSGLSILKYGNLNMENYLTVTKFTTGMETHLTTLSEIWSVLVYQSTEPCTANHYLRPEHLSREERLSKKTETRLMRGTEVKRDAGGIKSIGKKVLETYHQQKRSVSSVNLPILLSEKANLSIALTPASRKLRQGDVSSVEKIKIDSPIPVYNLSVENHNEYFANGILVHNCDSTRMLLAEGNLVATPLTAREKHIKILRATTALGDLKLPIGNDDFQGCLLRRQMELRELAKREEETETEIVSILNGLIKPPG